MLLSLSLSLLKLMSLVVVEFRLYVIIQSMKQGNIAEKRDTPIPFHVKKGIGCGNSAKPLYNSLYGKWMTIAEIKLKQIYFSHSFRYF